MSRRRRAACFLPAVAAAARRPAVTGIPLFLIAHAKFVIVML